MVTTARCTIGVTASGLWPWMQAAFPSATKARQIVLIFMLLWRESSPGEFAGQIKALMLIRRVSANR